MYGEIIMTNFRTLALTALSGGLIAIGSSMALAQSVNNPDNTSPGESGHGTGCSNAHTMGSGVGAGSSNSTTNCYDSGNRSINSSNMNSKTQGGSSDMNTNEPSSNTLPTNSAAPNPDNTTNGESGHGTGCSNANTSASGNGAYNGGTETNCQNTTN
jgi:hypothetical protein